MEKSVPSFLLYEYKPKPMNSAEILITKLFRKPFKVKKGSEESDAGIYFGNKTVYITSINSKTLGVGLGLKPKEEMYHWFDLSDLIEVKPKSKYKL